MTLGVSLWISAPPHLIRTQLLKEMFVLTHLLRRWRSIFESQVGHVDALVLELGDFVRWFTHSNHIEHVMPFQLLYIVLYGRVSRTVSYKKFHVLEFDFRRSGSKIFGSHVLTRWWIAHLTRANDNPTVLPLSWYGGGWAFPDYCWNQRRQNLLFQLLLRLLPAISSYFLRLSWASVSNSTQLNNFINFLYLIPCRIYLQQDFSLYQVRGDTGPEVTR